MRNDTEKAIRILSGAEESDYNEYAAARKVAVAGLCELEKYRELGTVEEITRLLAVQGRNAKNN